MPYDLYGQYYASERDAINAEMAQCAEIDARLAYEKAEKLERQYHDRMQQEQYLGSEQIAFLMGKVQELEERIKLLESN